MLFSLALRNVLRNLRRLGPMMFSIALIFALLVLGNGVLNTTIKVLYSLYAERLSGDLTVSPTAESNFTIFGSDQMLVGSYLVPPTLVDFNELKDTAGSYEKVRAVAGLISSAARVEVGKKKEDLLLFGVDFEDYTRLVSRLELSSGRFPDPGEHGIVVQDTHFKDAVGKKALLTSGLGRNFTIREVPVTGSFSYPVEDESLQKIALVDAETTRALNGYLYGGGESPQISEEDKEALSGDFSEMFSISDQGDQSDQEAGGDIVDYTEDEVAGADTYDGTPADTDNADRIDPEALFSDSGPDMAPAPADSKAPSEGAASSSNPAADDAAWNFLLVSLHSREDIDGVASRLASDGFTEDAGFQVRDWSSSVGGNAQLAHYLQLLFNLGLLFVSFGAAIIAANALLLSILERREEIGTLRAVGATRLRVALLIFFETLLVVFASALIGIGIGAFALGRLNEASVVIDNRYINILFGGDPIRGDLGLLSILIHLAAAFALTVCSMLYPLKKALSISPVEAMAE